MVKSQVLSEEPISMAALRQELADIKKRDGELNFRGSKCEDYLNSVTKLSFKETQELTEEIDKLKVPRLRVEHNTKIADVLPQTVDELKVLLQGYVLTINQDNMKKIVETVKNHIAKNGGA